MVLLFTFVARSGPGKSSSFASSFLMVTSNAVFFFGYAYLTVYLLVPFLAFRKKYLLFFLAFLASGFLISFLKFQFSDFVFYTAIAPENQSAARELTFGEIITNTKDMTFIVALFSILKFARDHYHEKEVIRVLEKSSLEAEIKMLQNQLDPHVLFNNLNNLYAISLSTPEKLEPQLVKLKSVLHYIFEESRVPFVYLREEVLMIRNYIGLEKLRYGDRLKLEFTVEGVAGDLQVVPLILFSFVENCFEHGCSAETGPSWINIVLNIQEQGIQFTAENSIPDLFVSAGDEQPGGSIRQIRRRLELLYPGKHHLSIIESRERFKVELQMELDEYGR
ncbi:MAG: sensor histidine kinase [Bacteroidota bacterium]